jgi:hypothetical protein
LNRYAYTFNNPLKYTDPSGHRAKDPTEDSDVLHDSNDCTQNPGGKTNCDGAAPQAPGGSGMPDWARSRMSKAIEEQEKFFENYKNSIEGVNKTNSARNAQQRVSNYESQSKTYATIEDGTITTRSDGTITTRSGWTQAKGYDQGTDKAMALADKMNFTFKSNPIKDQGTPGRFQASHAETQAAALAPNQALGVSKDVCSECQRFLSSMAQHTGNVLVVADPNKVFMFFPNGMIGIIR